LRGGGNIFHWRREPIPDAWHGLDVLLAGGALAERLPQHRHVVIEIVFLDGRLGPDRVEQFLLGDQPSGVLHQHEQRVEYLQTERNDLTAARQAALASIEMKRPELVRPMDCAGGHLWSLRKISEIHQRSQRTRLTARFYPPDCADRNREEDNDDAETAS
jgi:hypothetical protein